MSDATIKTEKSVHQDVDRLLIGDGQAIAVSSHGKLPLASLTILFSHHGWFIETDAACGLNY
jgi:hypothetical protein